jgi:hypothetical protein
MGFITKDGNYGIFEFGQQWMVVYHSQQLDVFDTISECKSYILEHQAGLIKSPKRRKATTTSTKLNRNSRRNK